MLRKRGRTAIIDQQPVLTTQPLCEDREWAGASKRHKPGWRFVSAGDVVGRVEKLVRVDGAALPGCVRAKVVEAEALVPQAMADAFRSGNLGIMDYVRMKNVQADTSMRESIAGGDKPRTDGT